MDAMTSATRLESARRDRFPWSWTLPPIVVTVLTAVVGIIRYPNLPARIPIHFDLGGVADRTVRTTVPAAFAPVLIQAGVTAVLIATAVLMVRAPQATRRGRRLVVGAVLTLATCLDLAGFLLATQIWRAGGTLSNGAGAGALALVLAGVVIVVAAAIRANTAGRGPHEVDLDHYQGIFYVNRDDPKLFVPKRFGVGWTLNFGRPAAWVITGILLLALIAGAVAGS
jgi:uncharacterized membrane protein